MKDYFKENDDYNLEPGLNLSLACINSPVYTRIVEWYGGHAEAKKAAVLFHALLTSRRAVFMMSQPHLSSLISSDPNIPTKGCNFGQYRKLMAKLIQGGALVQLRPATSRRTHGIDLRAVYELKDPDMLEELCLSDAQVEAQREAFLDAYDSKLNSIPIQRTIKNKNEVRIKMASATFNPSPAPYGANNQPSEAVASPENNVNPPSRRKFVPKGTV
jgi:hypothetical protein